jgi:hypothetical protein
MAGPSRPDPREECRLLTGPGSRHAALTERPVEFADLVLDFLPENALDA